jgi:chemotaxis protein CheD
MNRSAQTLDAGTLLTVPMNRPKGEPVSVKIGPGEYYVTLANEMIVTVLGSCVSARIRDPFVGVGGMNHFMLPRSSTGIWGPAESRLRFGNFAMERLINEILQRGGQRRLLEIKIFGGADMNGSGMSVGRRNVEFVETYLHDEGFPIMGQDLRGSHPRRVHYFPMSGRVLMREMPFADRAVIKEEEGYVAQLDAEPVAGTIELFQ